MPSVSAFEFACLSVYLFACVHAVCLSTCLKLSLVSVSVPWFLFWLACLALIDSSA